MASEPRKRGSEKQGLLGGSGESSSCFGESVHPPVSFPVPFGDMPEKCTEHLPSSSTLGKPVWSFSS